MTGYSAYDPLSSKHKWYRDSTLLRRLPLRYRAYAAYSRVAGSSTSRRVAGGSFLLRLLARMSAAAGLGTTVELSGIDGLIVIADMADERILDVIHELRGENPEYDVLRSCLKAGDTFVDIGANFGTFSLLASRIVGTTGRVIAIEPQPVLASNLRRSLSLSGVTNCELHEVACGRAKGESTLIIPRDDSGRAGFFPDFSGRPGSKPVEVQVSRLDDLVRSEVSAGAMLIKIDVEGSELDVLAGAEETISTRRPTILIELNPWSAKAAGTSTSALVRRLTQLGYKSFSVVGSGPVDLSAIPLDRQINLVAQP